MEDLFKPDNFFDFTNCLFAELFEGKKYVWEVLKDLNEYIEQQFTNGKIIGNYKDSKNIFVGEGTIIEEGALIKGPSIIGKNCFIGHGAFIRQNCLFEDSVSIGHASEVKNSIIFSQSAVAHLNYVGDSVIGHRVNIGGGAKTANFRLDGKTIPVKNEDQKIDTGLTKFGSILGDGTKIGVNAVLNPGTILGKHVFVYPLTLVFGTHNDDSIIK